MNKRIVFLTIGILMIVIMITFLIYAIGHPEKSFPFSAKTSNMIYLAYVVSIIIAFVLAGINK